MEELNSYLHFEEQELSCIAGGRSVLDTPSLMISDFEAAEAFIQSYGFDISHPSNLDKLWYYHRRSIVLLNEKLKYPLEAIPEVLLDRKNLVDIRRLLLFASGHDGLGNPVDSGIQKWSCALLRCIHVFVHHESDPFHSFSEEIQGQVLGAFQNHVFHDGTTDQIFLRSLSTNNLEHVELVAFEQKSFKSSVSSVIKLLSKPDAIAYRLLDHLGVRFVTRNVFDSFRVIRLLLREGLVSYPHVIPEQTSNNIFPIELFLKVLKEMSAETILPEAEKIEKKLQEALQLKGGDLSEGLFRKANGYSSGEHRFIKFICRKMIQIEGVGAPSGQIDKSFRFFFPYEIQILDEASYHKTRSGEAGHEAYKERQIEAARKRLFP